MIVNETVAGLVAIGSAYLIGAFPSAFIVTRMLTGKDIRLLGSGNAGANNTFHEVGMPAAVVVGVLDLGKGAGAVALAHWLLDVPLFDLNVFVLLAGIGAVAGHMWPVYLRFRGGNGLSPSIGMMGLLLPRELLIVIGTIVILIALTRSVVLSANLGLLTAPFSALLLEGDWLYVGFFVVLALMMILNFLPTARAALESAGSTRNLVADLLRRDHRG
jgi:glycerol-3-phosphate acyltransferase PlsY